MAIDGFKLVIGAKQLLPAGLALPLGDCAQRVEPARDGGEEPVLGLHIGGDRPEQRRLGLVGAVRTPKSLDGGRGDEIADFLFGDARQRRKAYPQIANAVQAGALAVVVEKFDPAPWPVSLVFTGQRLLPLTLRAFLDFAVASRRGRCATAAEAGTMDG